MYLLAWDYHFILNGFQFYFCFQWYGLLLITESP
nr:MAG TPA: RNA recognition motif protein [Caudoviricetes sp.]